MTYTRLNNGNSIHVIGIDRADLSIYHEPQHSFARLDYILNGTRYALQWGLDLPHLALFQFNSDGTYTQVWSANVT